MEIEMIMEVWRNVPGLEETHLWYQIWCRAQWIKLTIEGMQRRD